MLGWGRRGREKRRGEAEENESLRWWAREDRKELEKDGGRKIANVYSVTNPTNPDNRGTSPLLVSYLLTFFGTAIIFLLR